MVVRSDGVGVDNDRSTDDGSTDMTDNVVLRVSRPGDGYYTSAGNGQQEDTPDTNCSTFLIFGIMMGCLLIVASVMMCLLAYRLNSMAAEHKVGRAISNIKHPRLHVMFQRDKTDCVLRDHRQKYGLGPGFSSWKSEA